MNFAGLKLGVIITVFFAALSALFGGYYLYERQRVEQPLMVAYGSEESVKDVRIAKEDGITTVEVALDYTEDFRDTYLKLKEAAVRRFGTRRFEIKVKDNRDKALRDAYYKIHFSIAEAVQTGEFTKMVASIDKILADSSVDKYKVFVDTDAVYVQLHHGDSNLYELVPRPPQGQVGVS